MQHSRGGGASARKEQFDVRRERPGIAKKGWEYLWVRYADAEDGAAHAIVKKPIAVYIEKVYEEGAFASLGGHLLRLDRRRRWNVLTARHPLCRAGQEQLPRCQAAQLALHLRHRRLALDPDRQGRRRRRNAPRRRRHHRHQRDIGTDDIQVTIEWNPASNNAGTANITILWRSADLSTTHYSGTFSNVDLSSVPWTTSRLGVKEDGGFSGNLYTRALSFTPPPPVPPTADIIDITPDPHPGAINEVQVVFSKPVTGFELADLFLTRNGSVVALDGATRVTADNITWLENLGGITIASGNYVLTLTASGSDIVDEQNTPLVGSALDAFKIRTTLIAGTSGNDTYHVKPNGAGGILTATTAAPRQR